MIYDLHIHTTKSDGKYDRYKLLKYFIDNDYKYISFTDHNYISDIENLNTFIKDNNSNLILINGIEFDVSNYKDMHLLGYDIKNIEKVKEEIEKIEKENKEICKRLIVNLKNKYGFDISYEELEEREMQISKGSIRKILVEKGYAENHLIAGDLYTGKNSYKYEQTKSLTYEDVIKLIKENGGIAVLAHPTTLKLDDQSLIEFIKKLKELGLDGIEVLNASKTDKRQLELYRNIAKVLDLLESCGSDFHNEEYTKTLGIENEISKKLIYKIKER